MATEPKRFVRLAKSQGENLLIKVHIRRLHSQVSRSKCNVLLIIILVLYTYSISIIISTERCRTSGKARTPSKSDRTVDPAQKVRLANIDTASLPAGRPLAKTRWGITKKLWLGFGLLVLILAFSGLVSSWHIHRIQQELQHITEVKEPLKEAVLEMEINAGEAARAVQEYVRDRNKEDLDRIRDSEADFARYAAAFEKIDKTNEEHRLGRKVVGLYDNFAALSRRIVALADSRHESVVLFRNQGQAIVASIDRNLHATIDRMAPESMKRLHNISGLEHTLDELIAATEGFLSGVEHAALRQEILEYEAKFKNDLAGYRKNNVSAEETKWLRRIDASLARFLPAMHSAVSLSASLHENLRNLEATLRSLDFVLDDQIQPLINEEMNKAEKEAQTSIKLAINFLLIFGVVACLIGGGLAWGLSRELTGPLSSLVSGTEIIGRGDLNHRIKVGNNDEIGHLAHSFNNIVDKLQHALRSAEDARDHLEQRVAERNAELRVELDQRKRAEANMRAAMEEADLANRTKSEFLASMSHELRTPLNAIIGFSDIMNKESLGPVGSPQYREYAGDIHTAGNHLLSLINDVLDISKIEAGQVELYDEDIDLARIIHGRRMI